MPPKKNKVQLAKERAEKEKAKEVLAAAAIGVAGEGAAAAPAGSKIFSGGVINIDALCNAIKENDCEAVADFIAREGSKGMILAIINPASPPTHYCKTPEMLRTIVGPAKESIGLLHTRSFSGISYTFLALRHGELDLVKCLTDEMGIDAEWRDERGRNVAHITAGNPDPKVFLHAVKKFPDLLVTPNSVGQFPVDLIFAKGGMRHLEAVLADPELRLLVEKGHFQDGGSLIHQALFVINDFNLSFMRESALDAATFAEIKTDQQIALEFVVREFPHLLLEKNAAGKTPLMQAFLYGQNSSVAGIIHAHPDILLEDESLLADDRILPIVKKFADSLEGRVREGLLDLAYAKVCGLLEEGDINQAAKIAVIFPELKSKAFPTEIEASSLTAFQKAFEKIEKSMTSPSSSTDSRAHSHLTDAGAVTSKRNNTLTRL